MTSTDDDGRRERYAAEGSGWFEVINPRGTTTHLAYVHENGDLYIPEGTDALTAEEFAFASARDRVHPLIRVSAAMAVADTEQRDLRARLERAETERDRARDTAVALENELARATDQLAAVRALHVDSYTARRTGRGTDTPPDYWTPYCTHDQQDHPCATIRALDTTPEATP